ncbi:unnamed protein product [Ectocarpus sp. CCAP 1310/34]|nr:unnamed protein product [Ectocarpus sp. CCAP 1310/34]
MIYSTAIMVTAKKKRRGGRLGPGGRTLMFCMS